MFYCGMPFLICMLLFLFAGYLLRLGAPEMTRIAQIEKRDTK